MKNWILCAALLIISSLAFGQKLQIGAALAPDFDYFRGQRLNNGFDYNFRLGAWAEVNPYDRFGLRVGLFPQLYGATFQNLNPLFPGVEQFSSFDMDVTAELRFYAVQVNDVTLALGAGLLVPINLFTRSFFSNQGGAANSSQGFFTPEIMIGPGIVWNSGKRFDITFDFIYRRALNNFNQFGVAVIDVRLGLAWQLFGKR